MEASIKEAVITSLAQLMGCAADEISDHDDLVDDLGVDSFISVNLLLAVEDRLNSPLPKGCEGSFVDIRTVDELVKRFEAVYALDAKTREALGDDVMIPFEPRN